MKEIEGKNIDSMAGKPRLSQLNFNPFPETIFMASFSDFP